MSTVRTTQPPRQRSALVGIALAFALCLLAFAAQAAAPQDALSKEDQACLQCHAKPDLEKTLASGERLSLHIAAKGFTASVHASSGCEGCHSDLDAKHATQSRNIASRRSLALAQMEACRDCHKKTMKQYEDSVHSALVRAGSDKAPLCTDCHNPHATRSAKEQGAGAAQAAPCQQCHQAIAVAFAQSVHGQGGGEALVCKDCHRTHNIQPAALGDHLRGECLSCHKDAPTTHAQWLPNAQRHLEAISCPACHSPGATRRVNLRLYEGGVPQQAGSVGVPKFVKLGTAADGNGGLDARALWSLLQEFNRGDVPGKTVLRGRLEVQTAVQAHQLAAKALAVKDCDTCHREGAASFQSVTVSMAGPDGRPLRHEASRGVLTSIESVGAVGGFYAIGSTRIKLLDALLLLALAAGLCIPGAHLAMKLYFRRRHEREQLANAGRACTGDADNRR
jgi:ssDNA-binding Zn-finger/Zn-ribbon topoisomerase 1